MHTSSLSIRFSLFILLFSVITHANSAKQVKTTPAKEVTYYPSYSFTGTVISAQDSQVSSLISAQLIEAKMNVGEIVEKGQLLAVLDCADTKDQLDLLANNRQEINANIELNRLQLNRLQKLQNRQLAAVSQVDELTAQKKSLIAQKASIDVQQRLLQRQISRCVVRAPFKAVIHKQLAGEGQWLNVGSPIYHIEQISDAEIEVKIPLKHSAKALLDSAVINASNDKHTNLTLLRAAPLVEPQSLMQTIWYKAPSNLLLGQQVTVQLSENKLYLPSTLLVQRDGKVGYFTVQNKTARFNPINDAQIGRPAELNKNHHNSKIVIEGQQLLQHGDSVK